MNAARDEFCAAALLRLLLGDPSGPVAQDEAEWQAWLQLARRNMVLIRTADRLAEVGVRPPGFFAEAVARERQRVRGAVELIREISQLCCRNNLPLVFKAFQDYPDMGHDVDVIVPRGAWAVDELLRRELAARCEKRGLMSRLAGTAAYELSSGSSPVEIYHGRFGRLGEYWAYGDLLLGRRRPVVVGDTPCSVLAPEDQLLVRAVQSFWVRRHLRLADVVTTRAALTEGSLDWDYVLTISRRTELFPTLCCYLGCVEQIGADLFGPALLPPLLRETLARSGGVRVDFRGACYRFAGVGAVGRTYLQTFQAAVAIYDWDCAGRLCPLPLVAAGALARKLANRARRRSRSSRTAGSAAAAPAGASEKPGGASFRLQWGVCPAAAGSMPG